jgi:hypothetical protein
MKTLNAKILNWRVDDDGIMRVTARVLVGGVFGYLRREFDESSPDDETEVPVFIDPKEFTPEALKSLEGKPAVRDEHEWRTAENALKDDFTVGSIAGTPKIKNEMNQTFIETDITVLNPATIEQIKNKELVDISAGYRADYVDEQGEYNGKKYEAVQRNLVFNHVLLLPKGQGRCGEAVKIINQRQKETQMPETIVKMKVGNSVRSMRFSNEADAKIAEEAMNEEKAHHESEKAANEKAHSEKVANLEKDIEIKNAELAALNEELEGVRAEVEHVLSDEAQEELAEELIAQREDEDAVLNSMGEQERSEVKNSLKTMNRTGRIEHLAKVVLNSRGVDASQWDTARLVGAFQLAAAEAKTQNKNPTKKVVNGVTSAQTGNTGKARMFNHFPNKKGDK